MVSGTGVGMQFDLGAALNSGLGAAAGVGTALINANAAERIAKGGGKAVSKNSGTILAVAGIGGAIVLGLVALIVFRPRS